MLFNLAAWRFEKVVALGQEQKCCKGNHVFNFFKSPCPKKHEIGLTERFNNVCTSGGGQQ
jgi:hypothetical protein